MTHQEPLLLLLLLLLQQIHLVLVYSLIPSSAGTYTNHTTVPATLPCLPDQASALLRLKRSFSTTNESVMAFRSWRTGTDCCRWEGIRCDHAVGRVTSLDLGDRGLQSGGLNHALFDLTSLQYLNLAYNDFNGSQLPSIGFELLIKLTYLNLSSSAFHGQIPIGLRFLINLVSLDLSAGFQVFELNTEGYLLSDSDTLLVEPNLEALLANLSNLRELRLGPVDLSDNGARWCDALAKFSPKLRVLSLPLCRLSGPICDSLSSLHSLAVIDLAMNYLSGPFPKFLNNFSNLSILQLQHNDLEGWVSPAIFKHKKLVTINLYKNHRISGYLPNFSSDSCLENLLVGHTNFSGIIPSSIGNIKTLKALDLSAAGFFGEFPSSVGKLNSLNTLQISGMGIVGSMPSWVANLTSLVTLEFSYCGLSGSIPSFIGYFTKLEILVLSNCGFSGEIPSHISNLTQLQVLILVSNNFIGTMELTFFRNMPHLVALHLSDNNLVVVDGEYNSSLASLPKLADLGLSGCNISKFPNFLRYQDEIILLDLSNNKIHGAIPSWAWEIWNNFFVLDLANNKLNSIGHGPLLPIVVRSVFDISNNMFEGPMPIPQGSVEVLDFSDNMFSSIPSNFSSHLSDVYLLWASENNFSGNIPTSFCEIMNIQFLDLSYNNFNGSIPYCLMENSNGMKSLYLKKNRLHGEIPDNINEGCSFEALDISGNRIEGRLPRSLVACKNLEVLDVGENQITDSFPCWMSTLHRLEVIVLKSNKFFGHVAQYLAEEKSICSFPSARIIDLSSNNFSGLLPQDQWFMELKSMIFRDSNMSLVMEHELPHLTETYKYTTTITYKGQDTTFEKILRTLVFIDISDNAFYGSIPKTIWELSLIHGLNLSHNLLAGTIPSQVGHLDQLEALDLSSNELSGVIPQELASMDFLTTLNLSYNKLEGAIPESAHFLTFPNSSFMGNTGLCGPPLTKECINTTNTNVVPHPVKNRSADIILFLITGMGLGLGFAVAIIALWGIRIRKRSPGRTPR